MIPLAVLPIGARVRVRRGALPIDSRLLGRTGVVVESSEYSPNAYGVTLDGETQVRVFQPSELEMIEQRLLPPEQRAAKQRPALP